MKDALSRGIPTPISCSVKPPNGSWFFRVQTPLAGDSANRFVLTDPHRFTHVRFRIFPDGGVARLRLHGEAMPHPRAFGRDGADIDLAAVENGGRVVASSDMFFGSGHNLIMPGRATNMGDGWETRRRRTPGHEWCVVRLAGQGTIRRVLVDTTHFKGNAPASCQIEVCDASSRPLDALLQDESAWREVLPLDRLLPNTPHWFDDDTVRAQPPATHARIKIFPEGGVSRLRLWGPVAPRGREARGHAAAQRPVAPAIALGASSVLRVEAMVRADGRAATIRELRCAAREAQTRYGAASMPPTGARRTFAAHPGQDRRKARGQRHAHLVGTRAGRRAWCERRYARRVACTTLNQNYAAQFGYIYIVCATGKSADQMLGLLRERMQNDPATELPIAADEQRKITALRLEKWVVGG